MRDELTVGELDIVKTLMMLARRGWRATGAYELVRFDAGPKDLSTTVRLKDNCAEYIAGLMWLMPKLVKAAEVGLEAESRKDETEDLRAKVASLDTALWAKDGALKESEERVAGLEYRVKVLTAEANDLRASLFSANEGRTKRIEGHEREMKHQRISLEAEINRLTISLAVEQDKHTATKEELRRSEQSVSDLSNRRDELATESNARLRELTTLRKEKQARSEDSEKARLTGEVGRLTYELEHARQGCRTRQADLDTAQGRVVLLGREVTDLRDELAKMTQYLDNERKVLCHTKTKLTDAETDAAGAHRSIANLQDQLAHEMQEVVRLKKLGGREDVFKVAALAKQCSRLEEALAQTIADLKCEREERASESKSVRASVGRINELQGILEDVSRKLTKESIRLCDASPPLGDRAAT
jgi:hypothetical protein